MGTRAKFVAPGLCSSLRLDLAELVPLTTTPGTGARWTTWPMVGTQQRGYQQTKRSIHDERCTFRYH